MKRFNAWIALSHMMMWVDDGIYWVWGLSHRLIMKVNWYFLKQSRKHIPNEYQDQLVCLGEIDSSCEELGCWEIN